MKILLLCDSYRMAHRVMRAAGQTGAQIYVLGSTRARGLALSRHCRTFRLMGEGFAPPDPSRVIEVINDLVAGRGIDLIMPADPNTSRFLIAVRDRLRRRTFPAPDLATFDRLNDKAEFARLITDLGGRCPASRLFADAHALGQAWRRGELAAPSIAKPLSQSGGRGLRALPQRGAGAAIGRIDYRPILVQDVIEGAHLSASVFCVAGEITAFIAYRRARGRFWFSAPPEIRRLIATLARRHGLEGIFNFDVVVQSGTGDVYWLDCNPRVFFSIDVVAAAAVNFIALGLGHGLVKGLEGPPPRGAMAATLKAVGLKLLRPWTVSALEWRYLAGRLSDPVAFVVDGLTRK